MNSKQIKEVLGIARPALFALFGQQRLKLVAYSSLSIDFYGYSGWFQIYGEKTEKFYRVELYQNQVESLAEGMLEFGR